LYISDQVRPSITSDYDIAVGPGATPVDLGAGAASEQTQAQPDNPRAGLVVILVAVLILGTIFSLAARQRVPPARRLLVEIAELDNQNAEKPSPRYEEQRAELVRRLRETA
jgi:hypothetical protein